jgi:gluconolactonase
MSIPLQTLSISHSTAHVHNARVQLLSLLLVTTASMLLAQSPVPPNASLEKIATGFQFVEGPVWKDGVGLLFSDISASKIYRWNSSVGVSTYLDPSSNSNGLTFDRDGRLILTQMGLRRVARRDSDGTIAPLVTTYGGKRFNSPNDVVVKSDGSIFFTDPNFNIPAGQSAELSIRGIYRIRPDGGLQVLDSTFDKPNGICFSPDEKKLYVNESPACKIYVWDVLDDSTIANKRLFYTIPASGYADGMKADTAGNVYCTGPTGVWIVSPGGTLLGKIATPETPANCAWGDADRQTLYITATTSVYRIRMSTTGIKDHGSLLFPTFKLFKNYPNPFNPSTVIDYEIASTRAVFPVHVRLIVNDVLGRTVETLVDKYQQPGMYSVRFPSAGLQLASGTYYSRLVAGDVAQTNRMILLK